MNAGAFLLVATLKDLERKGRLCHRQSVAPSRDFVICLLLASFPRRQSNRIVMQRSHLPTAGKRAAPGGWPLSVREAYKCVWWPPDASNQFSTPLNRCISLRMLSAPFQRRAYSESLQLEQVSEPPSKSSIIEGYRKKQLLKALDDLEAKLDIKQVWILYSSRIKPCLFTSPKIGIPLHFLKLGQMACLRVSKQRLSLQCFCWNDILRCNGRTITIASDVEGGR